MAKIYKDAVPPLAGRAYNITDNGDGSKKITDVTRYEEEGTPFSAADVLESCTLVFEHTKSGNVHNFVNPNPDAKMGRAKMTADVTAGDTFTVNGAPVTAYMGTDDAAGSMAGSAWNGKWVSFITEDGTLNFKGGGGKVTVTGLTADAVIMGTTVTVKQGSRTVQQTTGRLEVLATGNSGPAQATYNIVYWGRLGYTLINGTVDVDIAGTPKYLHIVRLNGTSKINICGKNSVGVYTEADGLTRKIKYPSLTTNSVYCAFVVLGIKD